MATVEWHRNAELPALSIWWRDANGELLDLTSVEGFTLRIGRPGREALLEKTAGIAGAEGEGTAPTGVPNVTVAWATGELDIDPGTHTAQLTARFASERDRVIE